MFASVLNKQITVEKETTSTNRVGTSQETFVFHKECWAQKSSDKGGRTEYDPYGQVPFSNDIFIIRYDETIDYKCRLIYNNNYYKIEHIEELGRRHWLKLKCIVWDRETLY